jgi:transposase
MKYSKEFKEEALKLSDEIGLKKAAQQLGIQYYTLSVIGRKYGLRFGNFL